ncbi:hypothetical protein [Nocardia iowensis]|uniref:Uncharacterized protein n=1 Tax=Nocardia iowensis TaxID=204891 RepID=A0ABX8RG15_NOCIO|nr:hypothetical protein [Nocardia iowensis]QXN88301.1 hypothetical protein KV110_22105 [Nocardia iowensis]
MVFTCALIGIALFLCVHFDRIPFVGDLTGPDQLLTLVIGAMLLTGSLAVWAIKTLYVVGREQRWSWKIAAVPVAVLAALIVGWAVEPAGFDSARQSMEART